MLSYHCKSCGSTDGFLNTYRGLWCPYCGSYAEVTAADMDADSIYIPPTQSAQCAELERMFRLIDGRYGEDFAHGLAA